MKRPNLERRAVVSYLRRLADYVETGRYKDWEARLTLSQPEHELNAMRGECELDAFRHYRAGDEITATLVLRRGTVQSKPRRKR